MTESESCVEHTHPKLQLSSVENRDEYAALVSKFFSLSYLGIVVVGPDGTVIAANPAARSCLGLDADPTGAGLLEFLPEASTVLEGISPGNRLTIERGEGKLSRVIELTADPIDSAGTHMILLRDVTQQRHIDERGLRVEQLAAAGKMAARLSHEIRNPLAGIFAGLHTIRAEAGLSSENLFLVDLVLEEARSVERALKRMLDATSLALASPRPVKVRALVEQAVQSVHEVACARDVDLRVVPGPPDAEVIADAKAMSRALRNLLENALDAVGSGGLIKLGWRVLGESEQRARLPGYRGRVMGIFGEDTGGGISEDLSMSGTFRPFSVSKQATTGLGLAVAQSIVEAHGGLLCLSKAPAGGTTGEILLPITEPQPCWEARALEKCPPREEQGACEDCEVKKSGSGILCWLETGRQRRTQGSNRPADCSGCPIFRQRALSPFFRHTGDSGKDT